jgi:cell division protein FtsL
MILEVVQYSEKVPSYILIVAVLIVIFGSIYVTCDKPEYEHDDVTDNFGI